MKFLNIIHRLLFLVTLYFQPLQIFAFSPVYFDNPIETDSLEVLKKNLNKKDSVINYLKDQIAKTSNFLETEKKELREKNFQFTTLLNDYNQLKNEKDVQIQSLRSEVFDLELNISELNKESLELKRDLDERYNLIKTLVAQINDKDFEIKNTTKNLIDTQRLYFESRENGDLLMRKANEEEMRANANRNEWYRNRDELNQTKSDLDSIELEKSNLEILFKQRQREYSELQDKILVLDGILEKEREKNIEYSNWIVIISTGVIILGSLIILIYILIHFIKRKNIYEIHTDDMFLKINISKLEIFERVSKTFFYLLIGTSLIIFIVTLMVSVFVLIRGADGLDLIVSEGFWKILIGIISPLAFFITAYNLFETKRLELSKFIFDKKL